MSALPSTTQSSLAPEFLNLKTEFDYFVVYVQHYIETQVQWKARQTKMIHKSLEERLEEVEWMVRNSEFISGDEQNKFLTTFRELHTTSDVAMRNHFIQSAHNSDAIIQIITILDTEFTKLEF